MAPDPRPRPSRSTALWGWPIIGVMLQRAQSRRFADDFETIGMRLGKHVPSDPRRLRRASDEQLHAMLAGTVATAAERIGLERELRRREAWAAPAGWAFWISVGALLVSILALIVTAIRH